MKTKTTVDLWEGARSPGEGWIDGDIDRREGLTPEAFEREYLRPKRPVIIAGAVKHWPAMSRWTPEYFAERYGDIQIAYAGQATPLRDLVDRALQSSFDAPDHSLYQALVTDISTDLLDDLTPELPYIAPNWLTDALESRLIPAGVKNMLRKLPEIGFKLSGAGSVLPVLHVDGFRIQAFSSLIYGRKVWAVFPPEQARFLYPLRSAPGVSTLPVSATVDLERFPLFRLATPIRFVVEAGDTVFMPAGWWHTTRAVTPTIGVAATMIRGPAWWGVTHEVYARARRTRSRYKGPLKALAYAGSMSAFGAMKTAQRFVTNR